MYCEEHGIALATTMHDYFFNAEWLTWPCNSQPISDNMNLQSTPPDHSWYWKLMLAKRVILKPLEWVRTSLIKMASQLRPSPTSRSLLTDLDMNDFRVCQDRTDRVTSQDSGIVERLLEWDFVGLNWCLTYYFKTFQCHVHFIAGGKMVA